MTMDVHTSVYSQQIIKRNHEIELKEDIKEGTKKEMKKERKE